MSVISAGERVLCWLLVVVCVTPISGMAQGSGSSTRFIPEELDQMLAPVALYPDSLLAQILMASTYPIEVVEADRWLKSNKNLKGAQLNAALERWDWDQSVKALIPFPRVLAMMSQKLDWTQRVGDALLCQEDEVMDTIQQLRSRAFAQGNLKSCREQKVIVEQQVIRVEPADPQVVYVPTYNPTVVYGTWWYPSYPPYSCYPVGGVVAAGLPSFGAGVAVGSAWNSAWGSWNWGGHQINTNINLNVNQNNSVGIDNIQTSRWRHDAKHRKGNPYRSRDLRERYGPAQPGDFAGRRSFLGFEQGKRADLDQELTVQARRLSGDNAGLAQQPLERSGNLTQPDSLELEERGPWNVFLGIGRGDDVQRFSDRGQRNRQHAGGTNAGGGTFRGRET